MANPDTIEDRTERAGRLMLEGALDLAEQLVREILAELPENAHALHLAGLLEHRRGRHAEAVPLLERAIGIDPQDVAAYNSCGEAYRGLGDLQSAEACFRQALQLAPGQSELHLNLGLTLWAAGRRAQAETYFKNVLSLRSDSPKANFCLGRLQLEDENPLAAEQSLRRALELQPDHAEASLLLGRSLALQGRTPEAAASFERAVCAQPNMAAARFEAARAAFELADEALAVERLSTAIALDPNIVPVPGARVGTGRSRPIEAWCSERGEEYTCVARPQWHKVAPPKVMPQEEGGEILEPPQPFSSDIFVARVGEALVLPSELLAMAPGGNLFIEGLASQAFKRLYTSRFIVHAADDGRLLMVLPEEILEIDAPCVLLGAAPSHFEWIFECLARLWAVRQRPALDLHPLVVQSGLTHWQKEMLEMLGYGQERLIEAPENAGLQCSELYLASLVSVGHFIAPVAIEHLRREFRKRVAAQPNAPQRLYLTRNRLGGRRLANEDELLPRLDRHGFVAVQAAELSVAEQLALLSSAQVVIGVEGAAMAHLFFAPPRAKIGLIVARGTQSTRYHGPSAALGQDCTYLIAEPEFGSNSTLADCDVVLGPDILEAFLSTI